jgi:hypothetical protein
MLENRFHDQPMAALADLAKSVPPATQLEQMIVDELAAKMGMKFEQRNFTEAELSRAEGFIEKYTGEKWTIHREK